MSMTREGKSALAPCPPAALLVGTLRFANPTIAAGKYIGIRNKHLTRSSFLRLPSVGTPKFFAEAWAFRVRGRLRMGGARKKSFATDGSEIESRSGCGACR